MPADDPRSDEELIAALNRGDASAFDAIYYRYRDRVLRLAFRFTSNHADAQDVLQETFTYFYRKFPGFELTAQLTTFVYPVVRHLSQAARRKGLTGAQAISDELPGFAPADPELARSELAAAMAGLSLDHRQVVLLRFVDDLTIDEIGAAMGIPPGTVKSRLHHAIAALREDARVRKFFDFP